MKKSSVKWLIALGVSFVLVLALMGGVVAFIDPYFHYHAPLDFVKYELQEERYQNNGIVKHFDYDAIITGSSMTECFKTSECDSLFGTKSVKVPYSGGSFKEVNDNLKVAFRYNQNIKMVVRCLDTNRFFQDKNQVDYDGFPEYLYDDSVWNDAPYLFNKEILLTALKNLHGFMVTKNNHISFDLYKNWSDYESYGIEEIMTKYNWDAVEVVDEQEPITEEDYARMDGNIEQNILSLVREHPETDFYIYFSPYSIYCYDYWYRTGVLEKQLLAEQYFIEKLIPYENIHLFSFMTAYDTIFDPNNYKDVAHHRGELNTQILQWMKEGEYELTQENYKEYCEEVWEFYTTFDFDSLFEE